MMKIQKVYLIGAGPGKADLITLRGLNILRQADVIIYDYLVDKDILKYVKKDAELICCDKLGKNRYSDGFLIHNEKISQLVVKKARQGRKVARLKNGDTSIFSRLSQELEALVKENIDFEIVPGVTSASAASGFSGIPLTDRRFASSCVFVTGHEDPLKKESALDWNSLANSGTIVLYMAIENLERIVKNLIKSSKSQSTPIAIIQDASLITQKILTGTLKDIVKKAKAKKIKPPAIIIIGEVVNLEKKFDWLKKTKKILFTGLSDERFFIKGNYFHLPLIRIEPLEDYKEFDNYLKNIRDFDPSTSLRVNGERSPEYIEGRSRTIDWIIFASRYGVEYFFKRLRIVGFDSRDLAGIKVAAIGNSTRQKLLEFAISADLVPKKESSEGLIQEFRKLDVKNKKIFLPRSDISDKGLSGALTKLGAIVTTNFAYKNVMPEDLPDLDLNLFNEIMFTSPSTVRNFKRRYKKIPRHVKVGCIGKVTLKEAKKCKILD